MPKIAVGVNACVRIQSHVMGRVEERPGNLPRKNIAKKIHGLSRTAWNRVGSGWNGR